MDLHQLLTHPLLVEGRWAWLAQVFFVVFLVVLANLIQRRVIAHLQRRAAASRSPWDDAVLDALGRPLGVLFWVVGLAFAAEVAQEASQVTLLAAAQPIRDVGVVATLAWFLVRLVRNTEKTLLQRRRETGEGVDPTTLNAVARLLRVSVAITSVLVILQTLGFSISGVLAFGGIGGIAVGFAAKDMLANFFGGLMIYLDRPFAVGDWIYSPDREIEGTVEEIGWRLTRIRSFDKRPIYVPNSVFANIAVVNPSRMSHRRIYETIGIRYCDGERMAAITAEVERMLREHPAIDASQTLMVHFNAFGPSSLDFFVYTFTKTTVWTEFHAIKQKILLEIHRIIRAHGADIAFPTRTLDLPPELTGAVAPRQTSGS
ncbi:mechanosensitive ion channel family protein [Endothiovibrio diazotrophicus]